LDPTVFESNEYRSPKDIETIWVFNKFFNGNSMPQDTNIYKLTTNNAYPIEESPLGIFDSCDSLDKCIFFILGSTPGSTTVYIYGVRPGIDATYPTSYAAFS
jgi:hypothetical protein